MRYIYNSFLYLLLPFILLRLLWRARKNKAYAVRMAERFGFFEFSALDGCIWVHAVSVGEVISAGPLVKGLLKKYPSLPVVLTTMTPTGSDQAKKLFGQTVIHTYVPYDYPFVVKKFLRFTKPKVLVLMETELWPNVLHFSAKNKVPIVMCNARLSAKSLAGYKKVPFFMEKVLGCVTRVSAQSKIDGDRFLDLGLDPQKLLIGGNIKFDISVGDEILSQAKELRLKFGKERPVWVAASTHKNEEEKVLVAAKEVLKVFPDALLILVPRHLERFDYVFDLCKSNGFNVLRYSDKTLPTSDTNIILGDVMGKLLSFYAASDVAFVGGSLVPWGGHNLLEPAALSKPVLSGPHLSAFLEISQMLGDANALVKVDDEMVLAKKLIELFSDALLREKFGVAAFNVVTKYRGATGRALDLIDGYLCECG